VRSGVAAQAGVRVPDEHARALRHIPRSMPYRWTACRHRTVPCSSEISSMRLKLGMLILSSAVLVLACDDDNDPTGNNTARVQFINAAAGTATTDVMLGTETLASSIGFQTGSSTCVEVAAGSHVLNFTSAGNILATTQSFSFEAGQQYTVVLGGIGATRTTLIVPDAFTTPSAGSNALRFINASSTAGDVYVTAPAAALGTAAVAALGANTATGGSSGLNAYMPFPTTNTQVRFFNTGTTTGTPRADITLANLPSSRVTTVVFTNAATVGGSAVLQINPCT
jgi:hypothetical protein